MDKQEQPSGGGAPSASERSNGGNATSPPNTGGRVESSELFPEESESTPRGGFDFPQPSSEQDSAKQSKGDVLPPPPQQQQQLQSGGGGAAAESPSSPKEAKKKLLLSPRPFQVGCAFFFFFFFCRGEECEAIACHRVGRIHTELKKLSLHNSNNLQRALTTRLGSNRGASGRENINNTIILVANTAKFEADMALRLPQPVRDFAAAAFGQFADADDTIAVDEELPLALKLVGHATNPLAFQDICSRFNLQFPRPAASSGENEPADDKVRLMALRRCLLRACICVCQSACQSALSSKPSTGVLALRAPVWRCAFSLVA